MAAFIRKLIERRVPQYFLVYIGVSWGLMQFTNFIVDVFLFSPHWTKLVIFASLMLWPGFLVFIYNHGRPGPDKWLLSDKISIPTNLVVAVFALFFMFRGEDLGAATTQIQVKDEEGNVVEHQVAKPEFKKRTMLFHFDPVSLGSEDEWLAYFICEGVVMELYSNNFFDPVPAELVKARMAQKGYPSQVGVPLSLKMELAEDTKSNWIFSGDISKTNDTYTLVTRLHAVADGSLVSERTYNGTDVFGLIDTISVDLSKDLELPSQNKVQDLPVVEYYSRNPDAFRAYVQASTELTFTNDFAKTTALLQQAVTADPNFTFAQFALARTLMGNNRAPEALAPSRAALEGIYRLPDRMQYIIKSDYYYINQEIDKSLAIIEMWAELYPDDQQALAALLQVQTAKNLRPEMITTLERMYALNSGLSDNLKRIANLHTSMGDFKAAEAALQRYMELYPEDVSGMLELALQQILAGERNKARTTLDKVSLLEPTNVPAQLLLARITGSEGLFQETEALYLEALELAGTPNEKVNIYSNMQVFYLAYGKAQQSILTQDTLFEEAGKFLPPLTLVLNKMNTLEPYFESGRLEEAHAIVAAVKAQLQPPIDVLAAIGSMRLSVEEENFDLAEADIQTLENFINQTRLENLRPNIVAAKADIATRTENWQQALELYLEIQQQNPSNTTIYTPIARSLRNLGRLDEARETIEKALFLIPAHAGAHVELSHLQEADGDLAAARQSMEKALEVWAQADPEYIPAARARERLATL